MKKTKTQDFAQRAIVHTTEQIGPKQAITPEGFLLCSDVPLARVGWMAYLPEQLVLTGDEEAEPGDDGVVMVYRGPDQLFRAETLASAEGKSVVNDHPERGETGGLVNTLNWGGLTKGIVINIRAGKDDDEDVILGDMLITDAIAINAIRTGKREVSMGYVADYLQEKPGEAFQKNIIFNHVALVDRGRCGPRCSISDRHHNPTEDKGTKMTQVTVGTAGNSKATRIRSAFRDAEALALDAVGDPPEGAGDEGGHVHVHLHNGTTEKPAASEPDQSQAPPAVDPNEARFAALESGQAEIVAQLAAIGDAVKALASAEAVDADEDAAEDAEDAVDAEKDAAESGEKAGGDGDDNKKAATMDSAALETSYRATLSLAEVLVPGFRMPTFDARAKRAKTVDTLCAARRKALDSAYATQDGKALVDGIHGAAPNMVAMDCAAVASLFKAAAGAKKLLNNSAATRDSGRMAKPAADRQEPGVRTLEDLNRANAAFYAQKH